MNRALRLFLLIVLLCLGSSAAGCTDAGDEPWYTPAPTPVMTITHTPLPTCPTLSSEAGLQMIAVNATSAPSVTRSSLP
jgi:hypothetical protein